MEGYCRTPDIWYNLRDCRSVRASEINFRGSQRYVKLKKYRNEQRAVLEAKNEEVGRQLVQASLKRRQNADTQTCNTPTKKQNKADISYMTLLGESISEAELARVEIYLEGLNLERERINMGK